MLTFKTRSREKQGRSSHIFAPKLNGEWRENKDMAERSEAEALAFLLQIWTEIEAKIKHVVVKRSEVEALEFLLQIWTEIALFFWWLVFLSTRQKFSEHRLTR